MSDILNGIETFAESWRPSPGDKIAGEIVDLDTRETQYGEYPILVLDVSAGTEDGHKIEAGEERSVHCFRTVIQNEIERKRPKVGDEIGIAYLGVPDGVDYHMYRVRLRRAQGNGEASPVPAPSDGANGDPGASQGRDGRRLVDANPEVAAKVRGKPLMEDDDPASLPF